MHSRAWLKDRLCPIQLSHSKAMEIEDLLGRLSDVNDSLSSSLSGASDPRSHTLARHRDILHDYTQACACPAQEKSTLLVYDYVSEHIALTASEDGLAPNAVSMQEFRRLQSALGAAKDRAELFAGSSETSPMQVKIPCQVSDARVPEQATALMSLPELIAKQMPCVVQLSSALKRRYLQDCMQNRAFDIWAC